ncbi:MAG: hypothetical protein ABSB77_20520 [Xanthobacteraceae bacterium]
MPPMIAPPSTAAPKPQPPPRHCTVSMAGEATFLITPALAIGIADATFATGTMLIASNTAIAAIVHRQRWRITNVFNHNHQLTKLI